MLEKFPCLKKDLTVRILFNLISLHWLRPLGRSLLHEFTLHAGNSQKELLIPILGNENFKFLSFSKIEALLKEFDHQTILSSPLEDIPANRLLYNRLLYKLMG